MKVKISNSIIYLFGALGGLLFGYDTGIISGAILFIKQDLKLNSLTEGIVVSSILVGAMIGSAISGALSDSYGRRKIIMISAIIFCIGAIGTATAFSIGTLIVFRIVLGIAVGGASTLVPMYLSEIAPSESRGALSALNQLMITIGILLAYIVNYAYANTVGGWRWMLGFAFLPAFILLIGMIFLPESPIWLYKKGKESEARIILSQLRKNKDIEWEIDEMKKANTQEQGTLKDLVSTWTRPALIIGIGLAFLQQFIGCNTVLYYAPTIISEAGLGKSAAILGTIGIGTVFVLVTVISIWLIDKLGRKKLLLIGNVGMSLSLLMLWAMNSFLKSSSSYSAYATILFLASYILFFGATWGPVVWVMLGEIFPFSVRGIGIGISAVINWLSNLLVSLTFPMLLEKFGSSLFLFYALMGVIAYIFVHQKVIETKEKSLEEIEFDLRERFEKSIKSVELN
ncbi:sugar porter family MFS transporter [Clostridium uliginosum]|uniref:MFS transporter, sugar porter (SP) family n=1 Tax=Clostridium uliginosum TaxID=119641 RepID=A0A1I1HXG0_9CLOT|nr:sugar porter family MFS transporter [Clostridium uliginosum]SFC28566.1 MFS transporter, sugar porter (SP) family [Clostridium uliginosum]